MRLAIALLLTALPAAAVAGDKAVRPSPAEVLARKCPLAGPQPVARPGLRRPDRWDAPVNLERAVWRRIDGCPVPVIVRRDVERRTDTLPPVR